VHRNKSCYFARDVVQHGLIAGSCRPLIVLFISKDNPKYEPVRYWRGPIWMSANWLLMLGLRKYDYNDLADKIKEDSLLLVKKSGFVEYFDPRDGSPKGAGGFSWTAAIAVDLILENRVLS